jgi:hypothetical protein
MELIVLAISFSASEVVGIAVGMVSRMASCSSSRCKRKAYRLGHIGEGHGRVPFVPQKAIASVPSDATCKLICTLAFLNVSRVSRTSPRLSSTKRFSMGIPSPSIACEIFFHFRPRQSESSRPCVAVTPNDGPFRTQKRPIESPVRILLACKIAKPATVLNRQLL